MNAKAPEASVVARAAAPPVSRTVIPESAVPKPSSTFPRMATRAVLVKSCVALAPLTVTAGVAGAKTWPAIAGVTYWGVTSGGGGAGGGPTGDVKITLRGVQ